MIVFGTPVPVSVWTLVVLVAGTVLSLLLWQPLARWRRWQPAVTLASLLWLTVTLALTVTPKGHDPPIGLYACIPNDVHDLVFYNIFPTSGGLAGALLNLLLMLPLTFSLVLATRRVRPAVVVAVLLPFAVEFTQTHLPGRYCNLPDVLTNSVGALLGVALGWSALRLLRQARPGQWWPHTRGGDSAGSRGPSYCAEGTRRRDAGHQGGRRVD